MHHSNKQDNRLCYISRRALAGKRNSSMGPPTTRPTMRGRSTAELHITHQINMISKILIEQFGMGTIFPIWPASIASFARAWSLVLRKIKTSCSLFFCESRYAVSNPYTYYRYVDGLANVTGWLLLLKTHIHTQWLCVEEKNPRTIKNNSRD